MMLIPALRFRQSTATLYVGNMRVHDLCEIGVIESWEPEKGWDIEVQGYQRRAYEKHSRAIARFLRDTADALLPTSILLSARTSERGELGFQIISESAGHAFGYLEIPDSYVLYVVDGQHRMQGFIYAINELKQEHLQDFLLPVVILCGADKVEELSQFHLINNRQKRISTNLALALLGTVVEDLPHIAGMLVGRRGVWKMRAILTAIALNEGAEPENLWAGRISLPNELRGPLAVATLASFVKSLRPFFTATYPHKLYGSQLEGYLMRFWSALNAIMPKPFQSPGNYVLQRTTGVNSLNRVAAELARQKPEVLEASPQEIEPFLRADKAHMDENLWIRGGTLAQEYRGDARFKDLADEILTEMGCEPSRPKKT